MGKERPNAQMPATQGPYLIVHLRVSCWDLDLKSSKNHRPSHRTIAPLSIHLILVSLGVTVVALRGHHSLRHL